jgi:hypothetical protein
MILPSPDSTWSTIRTKQSLVSGGPPPAASAAAAAQGRLGREGASIA